VTVPSFINKFLEYAQTYTVWEAWLKANYYYASAKPACYNARCIINENNLTDTLKEITRDKPSNTYKYKKLLSSGNYATYTFTLP